MSGFPARWRALGARRQWSLVLGAAGLVGLIAAFGLRRDTEYRHTTMKVERGEIRDVVDLTGTVNAVTTVQVGSQVSGTIARLFADFNSRVRRGQVVALIDSTLLVGALRQATADLEGARANLQAAQAGLGKANADVTQTRAAFDRTAALAREGLDTEQSLEQARAALQSAQAALGVAEASVAQARAQVSQKEAAVAIAQTNLDHTVIRSPIDGVVVARNVDVGQTVAASLQAPTLFTIAQDLTRMQLYAKTDESDVGRFRTGQSALFKVDAFPQDTFRGTVSQIRMNPTIVQNVVTYDAIIDFANPDLKLFPGMTAYITIPVATAENAIKLPNAALRYRPPLSPDEVRALYARYGLDDDGAPAGAGPAHPARAVSAVVWKLRGDNTLEPVRVTLGITDHAFTEVTGVVRGALKVGDDVVIRTTRTGSSLPGAVRR